MLRVLLVEDNRYLGNMLEYYLSSMGVAVCRAASISEALAALRSEPIDCIISDYFVEDGTVIDIVAKGIPLIVMSGFPPTFDPELLVQSWVTKPFDLGDIEHLVRKLVAKSA